MKLALKLVRRGVVCSYGIHIKGCAKPYPSDDVKRQLASGPDVMAVNPSRAFRALARLRACAFDGRLICETDYQGQRQVFSAWTGLRADLFALKRQGVWEV